LTPFLPAATVIPEPVLLGSGQYQSVYWQNVNQFCSFCEPVLLGVWAISVSHVLFFSVLVSYQSSLFFGKKKQQTNCSWGSGQYLAVMFFSLVY
jgi:hypothetical protein